MILEQNSVMFESDGGEGCAEEQKSQKLFFFELNNKKKNCVTCTKISLLNQLEGKNKDLFLFLSRK